MKKIVTASLVAAMALTSVNAATNAQIVAKLSAMESEIAKLKKQLKKTNKKVNKVKAHDANDNIKWSADVRTSVDKITHKSALGNTFKNDSLMSMRLWLGMEFAPDENNIFKGKLSMNKAFGQDFIGPLSPFGTFDWTTNTALNDGTLRVKEAYWLYLGDKAFGADIPWTFSVGRRPSTNGFLASLREDDAPLSPLGHIINVEFDGLSSKIDLSSVTGVTGMSLKLCMGRGGMYANPLIGSATPGASVIEENIDLAGFIFEPYNDGQFIVKTTAFTAYNLIGLVNPADPTTMTTVGDMSGAAISVLVDGLAEDGFLSDTKVFASYAMSKTSPDAGNLAGGTMLGSTNSEKGYSYWVGAQFPVLGGQLGVEYNHGSKYWRSFTYGEDTMAGSKLATRGDAFEAYYTYPLTKALSAQLRYTQMNYDYAGSNGFFGNSGTPWTMAQAIGGGFGDNVVEKSEDLRFNIRYRF